MSDMSPFNRRTSDAELQAFRRSVAKRRHMTSRFVRRGASYWNALVAANKLFPLAPLPEADRREARRAA